MGKQTMKIFGRPIKPGRRIWPLAVAGLMGLMTLLSVHPASAGVLEERAALGADSVLAVALLPEELDDNRATGASAPIASLDGLQGQDVAVILWDDFTKNGGTIHFDDQSVSLSSSNTY